MNNFKTISNKQFLITVDIIFQPSDITYNDGGLIICNDAKTLELYVNDIIDYLKNKYEIKDIRIKKDTSSDNIDNKISIYKIDIFKGEQLIAHITTKEIIVHNISE